MMIAKALAEEVLASAMSGGADFVELFGEITRNNSINMVDGKIDRVTDNLVSGVGLPSMPCNRCIPADCGWL